MSLRNTAARILLWSALAALILYSFRSPHISSSAGLSMLMEPDGTGVWRDLVGQFNREYPGTPIQIVEGPPATNTREDMYSTSFLSGDVAYDIVYADGIWIAKFAAAGWLTDLSSRLRPEQREAFLQSEFTAGSYQGKLYRMPAFTDAGILFYRKDLVPAPPQTFEELRTMASGGFVWQGKQYEGLVTLFLEVLWGYGGDWIDSETRQVRIESPQAVQAIRFLRDAVGTISPAAVTTYAEEDARTIFQNGRAVFMRNWPYAWALLQQSPMKDQVGMTLMVHAPGQSSAATLGGWGFAISNFSQEPDRAWQFIDFLTQPESLRQVQQRQGRIPARIDMIPTEFAPILAAARPRPAIPEYAQASDILQRWLSAALTDRATPDQAVREIANETRLLLAEKQP